MAYTVSRAFELNKKKQKTKNWIPGCAHKTRPKAPLSTTICSHCRPTW